VRKHRGTQVGFDGTRAAETNRSTELEREKTNKNRKMDDERKRYFDNNPENPIVESMITTSYTVYETRKIYSTIKTRT